MTALNKSDRSGVNPRVAAPDVHTVMPGVQSEVNPRHRWQAAYVRRLAVSDVAMIVAAVLLAQWFRFGVDPAGVSTSGLGRYSYTAVSLVLIVAWIATLSIFRTRSIRVIGSGPEEYRRIFVSTVATLRA